MSEQNERRILIAGGGIGGLALALTLHQIGAPFRVFESVEELRPLGVGINLQPNAVRELFDLGIREAELAEIGVATQEWALLGYGGAEIYAEPRGRWAGYHWPQFSLHRGKLQMLLYRKLIERAGPSVMETGARVLGYDRRTDRGVDATIEAGGALRRERGALLIGADGLHSAIRARMHPSEGAIQWGGSVLWRGVTRARPVRTGASFVGLGGALRRLVFYPISAADPATGLADINWIAEATDAAAPEFRPGDWSRRVEYADFIHYFDGWEYAGLNVSAFLRGAERVWEYPMIDREPLSSWIDGPVALLGDAAHIMYPTGSNGASQAIIDARVLGAHLLAHGIGPAALAAYDAALARPVGELVLRNRGHGPFGILNLVEERSGGRYDDIDAVIPAAERAEYMASYKAAAGFAIETLNRAPPIISAGAALPHPIE